MTPCSRTRLVLGHLSSLAAVTLAVPFLSAGDIVRNTDTSGSLTSNTSWTGGVPPSNGDRALFTSNSTTTAGTASNLTGAASWGGILISSQAPSSLTINASSAQTLTLGGNGIDLNGGSATARGLTLGSNVAVSLGANQTWALGLSTANLTVAGVVSGSGSLTLTRASAGTAAVALNGVNTYSGGTIIDTNARVRVGSSSTVSGTTVTAGPLGTGNLTIRDGAFLSSTSSSGRDLAATTISLQGNITIGEAATGTGRLRLSGALDLTGAERVVTLASSTVGGNATTAAFGFTNLGSIVSSIGNGTLTIRSNATAGSNSLVHFNAQTNFTNNTALVLGANVVTSFGTSSAWGNNGATVIPNLTLQGGTLDLSDQATGNRNIGVASLSGTGTVTNGVTTSSALSTLTINGTSGNATNNTEFSGSIINGTTSNVAVVKNGSTVQILSGTNTYSGATTVNGGTLVFKNTASLSSSTTVTAASGSTALALGVGGTGDFTSGNITSLFTGSYANISLTTANTAVGIYTTGNFTYDGSVAATSRGLLKLGSATLTLTGSNAYTGATTIAAGTLGLSGANERISNSSNLVLAGGTLALNGFTETMNALSLTANSTIDLGSGGRLLLSDSSAANWSTGMVLTIAGTFVSGNSLQFGSAGGLTGTQLSQIQISGFQNLALDSSGFLTGSAIPEPSTYALLAGCAGLGLVIYRRRRQKAQALAVTQKL